MRKGGVAEWVLKRAAGAEGGAAIYGDLVELAATRGRLWFRMAYARTLMALTWRTPAAFVGAMTSLWVMLWAYPMWFQYQLHHMAAQPHVNMFFGRFAVVSRPFLTLICMCLWFALPFAWLAFGRRDRLTQFACLLFLATLPAYVHYWLIDVSSMCAVVVLLGAVFSSRWRRAFSILAVTCATGVTAVTTLFRLLAMSAGRTFLTYSPTKGAGWCATVCALAVAAFVCSILHKRLLCQRGAVA